MGGGGGSSGLWFAGRIDAGQRASASPWPSHWGPWSFQGGLRAGKQTDLCSQLQLRTAVFICDRYLPSPDLIRRKHLCPSKRLKNDASRPEALKLEHASDIPGQLVKHGLLGAILRVAD